MKHLIPIITAFVLLGLSANSRAQSAETLTPLEPGDTLPALSLQHVLNHPDAAINLQDYRGRWLILDFWATWCAPCIGMFPKADSLERLFEGELAFLPVTYEDETTVRKAFDKRTRLQGLKPPLVTGDTVLRELFPHEVLPHYVWIDPQGVVSAITGSGEINAEKIRAVLDSSATAGSLGRKEDQRLPFEPTDRLASLNPLLPRDQPVYSTTFTGYIEGLKGFYYYDIPRSGREGRIIVTNSSLYALYRIAYSTGTEFYRDNRIIYEVADKGKISWPGSERKEEEQLSEDYENWLRQGNGYCYELQIPPHMAGREKTLMQEDLDRLFPQYRASVEVRKHPVLALVRRGREEKFKSRGGEKKLEISPYGARVQHVPLSALLMRLNVQYLQHIPGPLINETGYDGPADLLLEAELTDVESLRKALQPYGLDLVEKKAKIKVLVIRDRAEKQ